MQDKSTIRIPLNSRKHPGLFAMIDEPDYEMVSQYKWRPCFTNGKFYARRGGNGAYMHRLIASPGRSQVVDHINHNGLDNRRDNLRVCTGSENQRNRSQLQVNNKSGFIGVYFDQKAERWRAKISVHGDSVYLGTFDNPIDAAMARDEAAKMQYGEFATLNFPEGNAVAQATATQEGTSDE